MSGFSWIDVSEYGADPSGTQDSAAAINAALAAAGSSPVVVPPGTYLLNAPIRVRDGTFLQMWGAEFIQSTGNAITNDANTLGGAGNHDITIEGGTFRIAPEYAGTCSVSFREVTGLRVRGVTLLGANSGNTVAFAMVNVSDAFIDGIYIDVYANPSQQNNGIWHFSGSRVVISNCIVHSGDDCYAFGVVGSVGQPFADCREDSITNCWGESRHGRVLYFASNVDWSCYGITASNVTGAASRESTSQAIAIQNISYGQCTVRDITISNCAIDAGSCGIGILIDGATDISISNVRLLGALGGGQTSATGGFVIRNTSEATAGNVVIRGCSVETHSANWGAFHVVPTSGTTISNLTLSDCDLISGTYGINLNAAAGSTIEWVRISNNSISYFAAATTGTHGLRLVSGARRVVAAGNTFRGYAYGFREEAGADLNLCLGNDVSGCTAPVFSVGGQRSAFRSNVGLNPRGVLSGSLTPAPAMGSSGASVRNASGIDCSVYVTCPAGVTVSAVRLQGGSLADATLTGVTVAPQTTSPPIPVAAGQSIQLTYAGGTPTWQWLGS